MSTSLSQASFVHRNSHPSIIPTLFPAHFARFRRQMGREHCHFLQRQRRERLGGRAELPLPRRQGESCRKEEIERRREVLKRLVTRYICCFTLTQPSRRLAFSPRSSKSSSFEGGVRGTGLLKFPKSQHDNLPSSFQGLSHVSDVMPTILGYIDRTSSSPPSPFPAGDAELGRGYDLSLPLFNMTEPQREDVLLQYEPASDRLGYRWGDWKLVSGQIGDPRRFLEPTSDMSWIGNTFHDRVSELIMHWQHSYDEDASGTMDETAREVSVTVQEYWR